MHTSLLVALAASIASASPLTSNADHQSHQGRAIPLFKRSTNPLTDENGAVNFAAAAAHLARANVKFRKGALNYQKQTGGRLLGATYYSPQEIGMMEAELERRAFAAMDEEQYFVQPTEQQEEEQDPNVTFFEDFGPRPDLEARAVFAFGIEEEVKAKMGPEHHIKANPKWTPVKASNPKAVTTTSKKSTPTPVVVPKKTTTTTSVKKTTSTTSIKIPVKTTSTPSSSKKVSSSANAKTSSSSATIKSSSSVVSKASSSSSVASAISSKAIPMEYKTNQAAGLAITSQSNDLLWAGSIYIGNPPQLFVIDFDTGSADLWVPSVNCTTSGCATHRKYNDAKSSTGSFVPGGALNIQYGDGSSTQGTVYKDVVTVAGISAVDQTFGVAMNLASDWADDPMDGLLGMGYQSISQMNVPPFFQTLMTQNRVVSGEFSFRIASASAGASELYLGGANPSQYSGNIEWHTVTSQSYWVVKGSVKVNSTPAASTNFIIDTGTTAIVAPPATAEAFWSQVPGAAAYGSGYYTYPCANPPTISFNFGGQDWPLSEDTLNIGRISAGSGRCVGSIVSQNIGINAVILGDKFLQNVYSTFSFDKNAVGFSTLK